MFRFGRGKLGMENYQIWEFFLVQTKNWFFFPSSLSGQVVFYAINKFHNFFLFKYDVEAIWLLMQHTWGAIQAYKIDLVESTQFSYYSTH